MIKFEPGLRRRIFFSGRFLTGKVAVNHIWGQRVNPLLVGAAQVVATTRSFNGDVYSLGLPAMSLSAAILTPQTL